MLNTREEIDALIVRYLHGDANPDEAMLLEDWKQEQPENDRYFLEMEKVFAATYGTEIFVSGSKESAWKVLENETKSTSETIPLWKTPLFLVSVAAAVAALLIITQVFSPQETEKVVDEKEHNSSILEKDKVIYASNNVAHYTLRDDSKVTLKPGSKLTIPTGFNKKKRYLSLEGSGTFEVIHDDQNPFILSVGELKIYDLGTIFHVDQIGDTVKVSVDEGVVELKVNGQHLALEEGDSAFYLIRERLIQEYEQPSARKDVVFEFDGTSLSEVMDVLSQFFQRKIVITNPNLKECELSVTFKNETLPTILDIIAELLDITIVRNNHTIEIHGESC